MRLNELDSAIFRLSCNYIDAGGDKANVDIADMTIILSNIIDDIFELDKAKKVKIKDLLFRLNERYRI